jgi:alpha-amylase
MTAMTAICLYLQIHQPFRLRRYSVFDTDPNYFDSQLNSRYMQAIAHRSYLPACRTLLELSRRFKGAFCFALSVTGTAVEQFKLYAPEVLVLLQELAAAGCVEFLSETYDHSLSALYSPEEFRQQIKLHRQMIKKYFDQLPRVFRNTNLIYSNEIGRLLAPLKLDGVIAEGWEGVLGVRPPTMVYLAQRENLKLLLRHYHLSDDISQRFSCHSWIQWPLTAEKYAGWLHGMNGQGDYCLLGMDMETFGERHSSDSGIFDFLFALPGHVLSMGDVFKTPSQLIEAFQPVAELSIPRNIGWTDVAHDLSPWLGNAMQANALQEIFRLEESIKFRDNQDLLSDWRRMTTSDHFFYMNTKLAEHGAFSIYESPYDAYMNYMSVLDNLASRTRP